LVIISSLEVQLRPQLNDSRRTSRSDGPEGAVRVQAIYARREAAADEPKICVVVQIERLEAELQVHSLDNLEVPDQGKITIEEARVSDIRERPPDVAEGVGGRVDEGRDIEPLVLCGIRELRRSACGVRACCKVVVGAGDQYWVSSL